MNSPIEFQVIDWKDIPKALLPGDTGNSIGQAVTLGNLQIRVVEYSQNYTADHWCSKGHIFHCLEGECLIELQSGSTFHLKSGRTFVVSDGLSLHRCSTRDRAKVLIIDGEFLSLQRPIL